MSGFVLSKGSRYVVEGARVIRLVIRFGLHGHVGGLCLYGVSLKNNMTHTHTTQALLIILCTSVWPLVFKSPA